MDKLYALPVSGESFLLRRESKSILVDGGYSSRALISALSAAGEGVKHLHIVVCTHADKDHAGGLTDFLDRGDLTVDEFWLPGSWSDSLPQLLQNPGLVVNVLVEEIDESVFDGELEFEDELVSEDAHVVDQDDDSFESRIHARIVKKRRWNQRDNEDLMRIQSEYDYEIDGLKWLEQQAADVQLTAENDSASAKAFNSGRSRVRYRATRKQLSHQLMTFGLELINTAERIRKIAVQAIRHHVKVRWFDFGEFARGGQASGGKPGLLIPLNSVELKVLPRPIRAMEYLARLTPVNEECLTFFSPPICPNVDLGVVFTGDSPLGSGIGYKKLSLDWPKPLPLGLRVVATAPHHGSESNAVAYSHLDQLTTVLLWLRSGGTSKHPGVTFRGLPSAIRGCMHCPHLRLDRTIAEVQLSIPKFTWPCMFRVKSHHCAC